MHPPWSMIFFTSLTGAAQGLLLMLVGIDICRAAGVLAVPPEPGFFLVGALLILVMSAVGLFAASFHLGHTRRAWRAIMMWRTSWLSREAIVMPVFMALVAVWAISLWIGRPLPWVGVVASALALLLYVCTGMIYGAVKAIRAWATPLTPLNFTLIGIATGAVLASALAAALAPTLVPVLVTIACVATAVAAFGRGLTLWRNLRPQSNTTLQTALGMRHPRIRQISQGSMGGSFNTREFFHGRSQAFVLKMRWLAVLAGFVLPVVVLLTVPPAAGVLALLVLVQMAGILAERWHFFAEARHTQNLYTQAVG